MLARPGLKIEDSRLSRNSFLDSSTLNPGCARTCSHILARPKYESEDFQKSGLRIFNLQSSIQDVLARASTSWIASSTYLKNPRKSCHRTFNPKSSVPASRSWITQVWNRKGGQAKHVPRVKLWMCTACILPLGEPRLLWGLRAGQDGRFSKNKTWRSSIFDAGGKTSESRKNCQVFLGGLD